MYKVIEQIQILVKIMQEDKKLMCNSLPNPSKRLSLAHENENEKGITR